MLTVELCLLPRSWSLGLLAPPSVLPQCVLLCAPPWDLRSWREAWVQEQPGSVSSAVTVTGHAGHSSAASTVYALLQPLLFFRTSFILYEGTDVRALQAHTGCRSGKRKKRVCVPLSSYGGPAFFSLYFFVCFLKG